MSFADIVKYFGFKTAKVGKWVTKEEQQIAANLMFDALCDLMDILSLPEQVISLNGTLSIAFGSGGQKHSSAHYAPQIRQLALAKNAGGGALAHEWFHAFDHYVSQYMFEKVAPLQFASELWLNDARTHSHPLNQALSHWFKMLFLNESGDEPHPYVIQSAMADRTLKLFYYAQPQEMAARAFEAIIQSSEIKNTFLVQGTKQSQEAKLGLYPTPEHLQAMSLPLYDYFSLLTYALVKQKDNP